MSATWKKLLEPWIGEVGKTESRTETLLFVAILCLPPPNVERSDESYLGTQAEIVANGAKYRIDIAIKVSDTLRFAIEVDGHEFHEKTKEQAARDRSRERDLISAGWRVIRFSGSEVWRDPIGCAKSAIATIEAAAR